MSWYNWIFLSLATSFMILFQLFSFKEISSNKFKPSILHVFLILLCGFILTYNTYINVNELRAYISYMIIVFLELFIYKENILKTIVYGTFCYILVVFSEIILDILLLLTNIIDLKNIDENIPGKIIISILVSCLAYIISRNKYIKKLISKIMNLIQKNRISFLVLIIFMVSLLIIAFKTIANLSLKYYLGDIVLVIIFILLFAYVFYNEYKIEKEVKNTKILLNFMADYEKKIDEDRTNKHELLNNLLLLKSYKDKNSKEYLDTLDNIINIYDKKSIGIKNIHKLPSGLKGILYYKMHDIKDKNIVYNINISKQLSNELETFDNKIYAAVCKIVGIALDNAIEACTKSKQKNIIFDIYKEKEMIVIDIENTYSGKIDINKINNKDYSTKGKNRGLGLYLAKNIVSNIKEISLEQFIEKKIFITKIYIKKI